MLLWKFRIRTRITPYCIVKEGWILLILDTITCQHGDKNHSLDVELNLTPSTTFSYITSLQILWVPLDYHNPFHPQHPFELFNFTICRTVFYCFNIWKFCYSWHVKNWKRRWTREMGNIHYSFIIAPKDHFNKSWRTWAMSVSDIVY